MRAGHDVFTLDDGRISLVVYLHKAAVAGLLFDRYDGGVVRPFADFLVKGQDFLIHLAD